jgi:hypothetical protein
MTMQHESFSDVAVAGQDVGEYEDADPGYLPTPLIVVPDPPAAEQPAEAKPKEVKPRAKPGDTWVPVDLAAVLAGDVQEPRPTVGVVEGADGLDLFYPGELASVFGDSGAGKSWLLALVVAQVVTAGRDAVVVDYEASANALVTRLQQVGVTPKQIVDHVIYVHPHESWTRYAASNLASAIEGRDLAVAVIDSAGEAIAMDGLNPNADEEVSNWMRGAARTLADAGAAAVMIDHVVKSRESGRNSEFASGSHRKRNAISCAYFLEAKTAPSRTNDGELWLWVRKDRHGWRQKNTVAAKILMVNGPDRQVQMKMVQPTETVTATEPAQDKVEHRMGQILATLRTAGPLSISALKDQLHVGHNSVVAAVNALTEQGRVTVAEGLRGAKMVTLTEAGAKDDGTVVEQPF